MFLFSAAVLATKVHRNPVHLWTTRLCSTPDWLVVVPSTSCQSGPVSQGCRSTPQSLAHTTSVHTSTKPCRASLTAGNMLLLNMGRWPMARHKINARVLAISGGYSTTQVKSLGTSRRYYHLWCVTCPHLTQSQASPHHTKSGVSATPLIKVTKCTCIIDTLIKFSLM